MTAFHVRQERAPDTEYVTFKRVHSARSVTMDGDLSTDADLGYSPVTRWFSFAIDYEDIASNSAGDAQVINLSIPRGTLLKDCYVRVDTAWTAEGADDVDIGDANLATGYADGLNWSAAVGTTPVWHRDASGADYIDTTTDITAGAAGAQYYPNGGTVIVTFNTAFTSTVPTAGRAIVFLETISYNEPQGSEWT
jgi:hypothetical protein